MTHADSTQTGQGAFRIPAGLDHALLIHGYMGSPREFLPLAMALADVGVTAQAVLLPGFGEDRERLGRVRAEDWLLAARSMWREMRGSGGRSILIGFSMGGAVALSLAAESRMAPDELILLAPHWRFADRRATFLPIGKHVIRTFRPFGRPNFEDPGTRVVLAEIAPGTDLDDPAVRHSLRDVFAVPTSSLDELRRIGVMAGATSRSYSGKTTIIQGTEDPTTLPKHSRTLAARMGAPLLLVPGDHMLVDPNRPSWLDVSEAILSRATGQPHGTATELTTR
jgi:carboxylesterase